MNMSWTRTALTLAAPLLALLLVASIVAASSASSEVEEESLWTSKEHLQRVQAEYKKLNSYLKTVVDTDDPEANFRFAHKMWQGSEDLNGSTPALTLFIKLGALKEFYSCTAKDTYWLTRNQEALGLVEKQERIYKIFVYISQQHAGKCQEDYEALFALKKKTWDEKMQRKLRAVINPYIMQIQEQQQQARRREVERRREEEQQQQQQQQQLNESKSKSGGSQNAAAATETAAAEVVEQEPASAESGGKQKSSSRLSLFGSLFDQSERNMDKGEKAAEAKVIKKREVDPLDSVFEAFGAERAAADAEQLDGGKKLAEQKSFARRKIEQKANQLDQTLRDRISIETKTRRGVTVALKRFIGAGILFAHMQQQHQLQKQRALLEERKQQQQQLQSQQQQKAATQVSETSSTGLMKRMPAFVKRIGIDFPTDESQKSETVPTPTVAQSEPAPEFSPAPKPKSEPEKTQTAAEQSEPKKGAEKDENTERQQETKKLSLIKNVLTYLSGLSHDKASDSSSSKKDESSSKKKQQSAEAHAAAATPLPAEVGPKSAVAQELPLVPPMEQTGRPPKQPEDSAKEAPTNSFAGVGNANKEEPRLHPLSPRLPPRPKKPEPRRRRLNIGITKRMIGLGNYRIDGVKGLKQLWPILSDLAKQREIEFANKDKRRERANIERFVKENLIEPCKEFLVHFKSVFPVAKFDLKYNARPSSTNEEFYLSFAEYEVCSDLAAQKEFLAKITNFALEDIEFQRAKQAAEQAAASKWSTSSLSSSPSSAMTSGEKKPKLGRK